MYLSALFSVSFLFVFIEYLNPSSSILTSSWADAKEHNPTKVVKKNKTRNNTGFYYGIRDDVFFPEEPDAIHKKQDGWGFKPIVEPFFHKEITSIQRNHHQFRNNGAVQSESSSTAALADILGETLLELREMREDIAALRDEMQSMKEEFSRNKPSREGATFLYTDQSSDNPNDPINQSESPIGLFRKHDRKKEYGSLGFEIEQWALSLLGEDGEDSGWREVKCNSMMNKKFNKHSQTQCFIKWMRDSRGDKAMEEDPEREYPCIKCFSTLAAPLEKVCQYLADSNHVPEYNDLLTHHKDLEEISSKSKICWAMTPQILFVKPRDFVTFCQYWWKKDGTQVIVNQACDHEDAPAHTNEDDGKVCRAYALRGANFLSRDPDDENKTKVTMIIHANPGGDLPMWAMKTAINAVAPIEPFKLFHKIEKGVNSFLKSINQEEYDDISTEMFIRPAGLSQLGYACFWPNK